MSANSSHMTRRESADVEVPPEEQKELDQEEIDEFEHTIPNYKQISRTREVFFVILLCISQLTTQACLAQTILPQRSIAEQFNIVDDAARISWLTASFSLTCGTFILVTGRLGDLYGVKLMFIIGYVVMAMWALISGCAALTTSDIFFNVARAFQGIGSSITIPNAVGLIGSYYPPGKRRALVVGVFGGIAPGGFVLGAVFSTIFQNYAWWPWTFWMATIVLSVCAVLCYFVIPGNIHSTSDDRSFDWLGSILGVSGLVLFNFVWNQAPIVGWQNPYVIVLLIVSVLFIIAFFYAETKVSSPLLPPELLSGSTGFILLCVFSGWSSFGIWIYFLFSVGINLEHSNTLVLSAELVPAAIAGMTCAVCTPWIVKNLKAGYVMLIAMCGFLAGSLISGLRPLHQTYWAQRFPAACLTPFGMDLSFPASTIILSMQLPRHQQGVAGSVVSTVVNYSVAFGLGIAGVVSTYLDPKGTRPFFDIRSAQYTGIGLAGMGLVCALAFIVYHDVFHKK